MAYKRSRATFEADLTAQQSPYVIYGTPLPPLDPDTRDDGSYLPVWKQEVTDDHGRKRLHGAFTGGFSAGYFNTVGSKEGWTPSTFVSSRANRKKDALPTQQRPEDFMDEEDMAEAEETRKVQTADAFAGLGSAAGERSRDDTFMDILKTSGETMGVKLLKRMGWREGQGVGPKIRRKARLEDDQEPESGIDQQMHLFAPENSIMIAFVRKSDYKGLGFEGEERLSGGGYVGGTSQPAYLASDNEKENPAFGAFRNASKPKKKRPERKGGFGTGILNDTGSDDEDPYQIGPSISYTRMIAGDKNKKKKKLKFEASKSSGNPLLNSKPVFISRKAGAEKVSAGFRKCHDGRLPLNGFVLSSNLNPPASNLPQDGKYPPPKIPPDWQSSKTSSKSNASVLANSCYQSPATIAAASRLSPKSRAALLGETLLPGKSVFDYLNPNARARIVSATNNPNLPPALGEADAHLPSSHPKTLSSLIPSLAKETALEALHRGTAGWMPYGEDPSKRTRYRLFLEIRAGLRAEGTLPDRAAGASNDEWVNEMNEFAHAAQIFKPVTGMMASRFTSSSSAPKLASDNVKSDGSTANPQLLAQPTAKAKTPAEEAAAVGMYGPLTRSVENFYPTRLLCKRFNVKPPAHVQVDPGDAPPSEQGNGARPLPTHSTAMPQKNLELIGKRDMDELRMSGGGMRGVGLKSGDEGGGGGEGQGREEVVVDPERNEAIEKERPGDEIFRAIFGSDSEDD